MRDIRNKEKIMNRKRSKKKTIGIIAAVIMILGIIGSVNGEEAETANAPNVTESTEEVLRTAEQEIYTTGLEMSQEAKTELEEAKTESDNPLMNAKIQIADVMNGTKSEKLGEWAEIQISKAVLEEITQEQFSEFCNDIVNESGYNWFTISCEDGTGIQFAGSIPYVSTYGSLDNEGCIAESMGTIMVQEDGKYIYTEVE